MIRSYGPGKYFKLIDSYLHEITLDGGADEEFSLGDGEGWYGFVTIDPPTVDRIEEIASEADDTLTDDEIALIRKSEAVIFHERSDGIVEADWFSSIQDAREAWTEIEEEFEEEIEDEDEDESEEGDDQ